MFFLKKVYEKFILEKKNLNSYERFYFANGLALLVPTGINTTVNNTAVTNFRTVKRWFRPGGGQADLKVYLVHPDDPVSGYTKEKWHGNYSDEWHIVSLKLQPGETFRCIAFRFIYELGHMLRAHHEGRIFQRIIVPDEHRLAEEVYMYTFDYKLLLAIGGPDFKSNAENFAFKIFRWRTGQQKRPPLDTGTEMALDQCFGPATTSEAREGRKIYYKAYCDIMAADLYLSPEEAYKHKREVIVRQQSAL